MKRRANVQPVGVVKTDTFNANAKLAQDIANASTAMMGFSPSLAGSHPVAGPALSPAET